MAGGLAFHRLRFAEATSLAVIVAAALPWRRGSGQPWAPPSVQRSLVAAPLFVSVLIFPGARAAAAALSLSLATLIRPRWALAVILASAVLAFLSIPGLRDRDSGERTGLLKAGLAAVLEHPLAGCGLGRYQPKDYATADAPAQVKEHGGKAHDQLVTFAAEGGVPFALMFTALLAWLGVRLWRSPESPARAAGLASLAFFALTCLLHDPLFHATTSEAVMLVLGGSLGLAEQKADEREAQLGSALQVQAAGEPRA
jgi:O-antigen ligase